MAAPVISLAAGTLTPWGCTINRESMTTSENSVGYFVNGVKVVCQKVGEGGPGPYYPWNYTGHDPTVGDTVSFVCRYYHLNTCTGTVERTSNTLNITFPAIHDGTTVASLGTWTSPSTTLTLNWGSDTYQSYVTSYSIHRQVNGGSWDIYKVGISPSLRTYQITGNTLNTIVALRVVTVYGSYGVISNTVTQEMYYIPTAPTLTGSTSGYYAQLDWTDSNSYHQDVEVYRRIHYTGVTFPSTGLSSYWKLDETSGTAVYDSKLGVNNGVATQVGWTTGKINNGFQHAIGNARWIQFGQIYNNKSTVPYSISAWIKKDGNHVYILNDNSDVTTCSKDFYLYNNQLWLRIVYNKTSNKLEVRTSESITDTNWHLVNVTYDGSRSPSGVKFYIDGVLKTTVTVSNTLTNTTNTLGYTLTSGNREGYTYSGKVDEIGYWNNTILSQSDITTLYNSGSGLTYSAGGVNPYTLLDTTGNDGNYQDYAVTPINYYDYKLRAKAGYSSPVYSPYSNEVTLLISFTPVVPIMSAYTITNITDTTSKANVEVKGTGGFPVTDRGVCWNTTGTPTIYDNKTSNGSGIGAFTADLTGLIQGTTYYVRAYGVNSVGVGYSNELTFTTLAYTVVTTSGLTQATLTSANGGGNVLSGSSITARGLCWSTSPTPTIANSKTVVTGTTGIFYSTITGLAQNTTYYVRAYATNSLGTNYGAQETIMINLYPPDLNGSTTTEVELTWSDSNIEHEHYHVYKSTQCFIVEDLLGYYPFGKSPYSDTGHNFYGDYPDMSTSGKYTTGKIDKCMYFDTYNQVASIGGTAGQFERTDAFTYSMWISQAFLFSGYYNDGEYLIYNISENRGYSAWLEYISGDTVVVTGSTKIRYWFNLYFRIQTAAGTYIQAKASNIPLLENFWYYLTLSYDGSSNNSGLKVYLDSVLQSTTNTGSALAATILSGTTNLLRFGNDAPPYLPPHQPPDYAPTNLFYGRMDEIGIWEKALSQTEIDYLYASGTGVQYSEPVPTLIATVDYPTLTYTDTGVTVDCSYEYCVTAFFDSYTPDIESDCSNAYTAIIGGIVGATGLTATNIGYTTCTLNWVNNNVSGVTGNYVQVFNGTGYTTIATVASGATTYDVTGLTPMTLYYFRITAYNVLQQAPSSRCQVNTLDPSPFNLHTTTTGLLHTDIEWDLPAIPYGTEIQIRYKLTGSTNYITASTLSITGTTYRFTGLIAGEVYDCVVVVIGSEYPSNYIQFTVPTFVVPPPFCDSINYTLTNSTCGNADGKLVIDNQNYVYSYDFTLTDLFGNSYSLSLNEYTGLTSGYYFLTATVKPAFYLYYFETTCTFEWIEIRDIDTSITLNDTKIKNAICGGFGGSKGRIIYQFSDSDTLVTGWTFTLWNEYGTKVNTQSFTGSSYTGITNIQYNAPAGTYYGIIENDLGCKYLLPLTLVDAERLYTVTGIQRLFITPWTAGVSYNYYDSTSDDWYVSGIDTQSFTSSKLKEYINLTDFWYEIKLNTAAMNYSEALQKDANGLTYTESVTVTIPKQENSKWKQLTNILTDRYIIVFQDNHEQWWTCFYRYGAEVKSYTLAENQYAITFRHPSVSKMLTAIDYSYVKLNIL